MGRRGQREGLRRVRGVHAGGPRRTGAKILGGNELGLSRTATTVRRAASAFRREEDFVVTDGPFAEVTERLGGYFEVEARDLDRVLELVRSLSSGTTEIRPIFEAGGQG
jgi:hypothetical protein